MPVIARSLVNYPQTISGQTIPPNGTRTYAGPTSALTTAQTNGLLKLVTVADDSAAAAGPGGRARVGTVTKNTPVAADNYTVPDDTEMMLFKHAGTLATLTVTMPVNPYDGMEVAMFFNAAVTALTMAAGATTLKAALTAATAGGFAKWRYDAADTTWYRVG